jgi:hypothetical protein
MTPDEYNDLWVTDRPVLVTIVTELRAELSAAQAALTQAERERDEARAELEMQRIDREDAQDDADVAEAIDEAARNDMICFVCELPMRSDQAVTDQDIDNICPKCASETIGVLEHANSTLRAGAEAADDYYQLVIERQRRTIRALVVAARAMWRILRSVYNGRVKMARSWIAEAKRQAKE